MKKRSRKPASASASSYLAAAASSGLRRKSSVTSQRYSDGFGAVRRDQCVSTGQGRPGDCPVRSLRYRLHVSITETVLVFVCIPLGVVLAVYALVYGTSAARSRR